MENRLEGMPKFSALEYLYVGYDMWKLTRPFMYFGDTRTVVVPTGFITDLDSVPRVPFMHAMLKGYTVRAATIHDYLYNTQRGKKFADTTFLMAMDDEGIPAARRYPIYWGVALFGAKAYSNYKVIT